MAIPYNHVYEWVHPKVCIDDRSSWVSSLFSTATPQPRVSYCINITVAETVPDEAFGRIVALTHELGEIDTNFEGLPIEVKRGDVTNVALVVSDAEDEMRERLLQLLVEDALEAESALPRTTRGPEDHSHAYGTTPSAHRGGADA